MIEMKEIVTLSKNEREALRLVENLCSGLMREAKNPEIVEAAENCLGAVYLLEETLN